MGRIALDKNHILVGCTGSVASLLTPRLVEELASLKYNVRNTFTETHSQYKYDYKKVHGVQIHLSFTKIQKEMIDNEKLDHFIMVGASGNSAIYP